MRFLIILFLSLGLNAQIPNTAGGWSLNDVRVELGLSSTASLQDCFTFSVPECFDPMYEGAKDRLSNYRNYNCTSISTYPIVLGYSEFSTSEACVLNFPSSTYYLNNAIWSAFALIYTDAAGTTFAPAGYYSDNNVWRYWNGTEMTSSGSC